MVRVSREKYVKRSELYFLTFLFLSAVTFVGGVIYLFLFRMYIDLKSSSIVVGFTLVLHWLFLWC